MLKEETVEKILEKHNYDKSFIIGILQDLQAEKKYLPRADIEYLSKKLKISMGELYRLATFYKAFSLKPRGEHIVHVCMGTACHVRGAANIKDKLERDLGVSAGETTPDMKVTLEEVNCLGCCAQGPVIVVDEEYHGEMNSAKTDKLIKDIKGKNGKKASKSKN